MAINAQNNDIKNAFCELSSTESHIELINVSLKCSALFMTVAMRHSVQ